MPIRLAQACLARLWKRNLEDGLVISLTYKVCLGWSGTSDMLVQNFCLPPVRFSDCFVVLSVCVVLLLRLALS